MRRAQSVRQYPRPSAIAGSDDLGVLREADEPAEDALRKQLIDKDRENDKLRDQIQQLQLQLAQRPPLEDVQVLEKEYKNLELILQGTQRENERCMAELERGKAREKMLERELSKLAGENWQSSLDIPPPPTLSSSTRSPFLHHPRANPLASLSLAMSSSPQLVGNFGQLAPAVALSDSPTSVTGSEMQHSSQDSQHQRRASMQSISEDQQLAAQQHQATLSHLEQVRLLILGMEQRLSMREDKLAKSVEKAEGEVKKYELLRKEVGTVL